MYAVFHKFFRISGCLLLLFLLYIIIGAIAPFLHSPEISEETAATFSIEDYYQDEAGADRCMLMETNQSALTERIRLLNQAEERIIISTFDMRPGESTSDLLSLLLHKAEEGVQIQMLVDGFSSLLHMEGQEIFYALSAHPNVEIRTYNNLNPLTPWTSQGRMHDKYLIVDDLAYILGGRNLFDYFIGDYPAASRSSDREVLIYNTAHGTDSRESSLFQVEAYFQEIWNLSVCTPFHDDTALLQKASVKEQTAFLKERYTAIQETYKNCFTAPDYEAFTLEAGRITLISNPTGIYGKEPVVFYTLSELMKQAESEVIIHSPYAVLNDYMYDTLSQITAEVPVTLMINARENGDNFFGSSDYTFNKEEVLSTGVSLLEYSGGLSYHGKSLIIDEDLAIIGSYNLDLRSTYADTELMLSIQSSALVKELKENMESLHEDCRIVHPDGSESVPDHVVIEEVPFIQKALWNVVGFLMQPFRFLI